MEGEGEGECEGACNATKFTASGIFHAIFRVIVDGDSDVRVSVGIGIGGKFNSV